MLLKIHLSLAVTNHPHSEDFLDNANLLTRYGIRGVCERACEEKRHSLPGSGSIWLERRVEARFAGLWLTMIRA